MAHNGQALSAVRRRREEKIGEAEIFFDQSPPHCRWRDVVRSSWRRKDEWTTWLRWALARCYDSDRREDVVATVWLNAVAGGGWLLCLAFTASYCRFALGWVSPSFFSEYSLPFQFFTESSIFNYQSACLITIQFSEYSLPFQFFTESSILYLPIRLFDSNSILWLLSVSIMIYENFLEWNCFPVSYTHLTLPTICSV